MERIKNWILIRAVSATIGKCTCWFYNLVCETWASNGQYLLVGGSNKKAALYTKEGTKLEEYVWNECFKH